MFDLAYPIKIESGTLALAAVPLQSTEQHITQYIETLTRERKLLPFYGLPDLVFRPGHSLRAVEAILLANLNRWFTGVRFEVSARLGVRIGTIHIIVTWERTPGRQINRRTPNTIDFQLEL